MLALDYNPDEPVLKPDAMQQNPPAATKSSACSPVGLPTFSGGPTFFSKPIRSSATTRTTSTCASPRTCTWPLAWTRRPSGNASCICPWGNGQAAGLGAGGGLGQHRRRGRGAGSGDIYARIGVPEYWRFESAGWCVSRGEARRGPVGGWGVPANRADDGAGRDSEGAQAEVLGLSLCWDENLAAALWDRVTGTYLENWPEVWEAREAAELRAAEAETQIAVEQAGRLAERAARRSAEARIRQLEGGATPSASGPVVSSSGPPPRGGRGRASP